MINMQSWMFLSSYEKLRGKLLLNSTVLTMAHIGPRGFDTIGGEVVSTTACIFQNNRNPDHIGDFLRLIDGMSEAEKSAMTKEAIKSPDCGWFYRVTSNDFQKIPGSPIAYWVGDGIKNAFEKNQQLSEYASIGKGLDTGNNEKYLKFWWELSLNNDNWIPCQKGGPFRKWYGNNEYKILWVNNGETLASEPKSNIRNSKNYFRRASVGPGYPLHQPHLDFFLRDKYLSQLDHAYSQIRRLH